MSSPSSPLHWTTPLEKLTIAAILLIVFFALAFYSLADAVHEGETARFDQTIITVLRTPGDLADPLGPPWFEEMMRDFSALGSNGVALLIMLFGFGYLRLTGHRETAALLLVAIVGGIAMASLLKLGFSRPRPELVAASTRVFTSSFPSSHAAVSATVYLTLGALLARAQPSTAVKAYVLAIAALIVFLIGASRVYLGVHWPSDVLAGWTVGAAWALAALLIASALDERAAGKRGGS